MAKLHERPPEKGEEGYGMYQYLSKQSETWKDFFKRELLPYDPDWAENQELLDALCEIMEENQ